jgi:hypothetical protein
MTVDVYYQMFTKVFKVVSVHYGILDMMLVQNTDTNNVKGE